MQEYKYMHQHKYNLFHHIFQLGGHGKFSFLVIVVFYDYIKTDRRTSCYWHKIFLGFLFSLVLLFSFKVIKVNISSVYRIN